MKRTDTSHISYLAFWVLLSGTSFAQVKPADSAQTLEAVEVTAYELKRSIFELASPLAVINKKQLNRFANNSLVPVMNSQPGIRLEERSPGSYRLNIRGSSLRAPFGVRNVKVYYNGIPYTTPGGDSYFNHIGFAGITSMEIIKGPGSSMYGAGTGGVLLLRTEPLSWKEGGQVMVSGGSYGSQNHSLQAIAGNEQFRNALLYQDQRSSGYRNQTALKRKVFNWDLSSRTGEKSRLDAHFMYADLFYETPGALNKKEFDSIPRSARPRSGATPGAVEAKASLRQTTFLSGFQYTYNVNSHWSDQTSLYGAFTRLRNPGIFNYSWVNEAHAGGRTVMSYRKEAFTFHTGMELQKGFTTAKTFKNVNGTADSLRSDDEVNNLLLVGFAQASYRFKSWTVDAGISINRFNSDITRLSVLPSTVKQKKFNNQWAPRIAVLKKVRSDLSVYASLGKGFSPPTTSELLPSSGIIATELQAEKGLNVEMGSRGKLWKRRIGYDITLFQFQLKDAIVVRRDALGRDYFVNAGSTRQQGIETQLNFRLGATRGLLSDNAAFWISYTGYSFRYVDFKKGSTDFSGKQMPSVPRHTLVAGLDLYTHKNWYALFSATYTDAIPLNDANTDWSTAYRLLSFRGGWKKKVGKQIETDIFISAENLTDERYSLGFDLNAAAGRYYNTAPGRNWMAGLILSMLK